VGNKYRKKAKKFQELEREKILSDKATEQSALCITSCIATNKSISKNENQNGAQSVGPDHTSAADWR